MAFLIGPTRAMATLGRCRHEDNERTGMHLCFSEYYGHSMKTIASSCVSKSCQQVS
jgi:hypothetical protein